MIFSDNNDSITITYTVRKSSPTQSNILIKHYFLYLNKAKFAHVNLFLNVLQLSTFYFAVYGCVHDFLWLFDISWLHIIKLGFGLGVKG